MLKENLKNSKNHTTISIPNVAVDFIPPLRKFYSEKMKIPLTKGETVAKALESEFKRNVKF